MIERYSFGNMQVNGKVYTSDLIIYPNGRVEGSWWRNSGHRLFAADIIGLIEEAPEVIIAGTGASGLMQPDPELIELLAEKDIEFIKRPTAEALEIFNRSFLSRKTGGCFHLTC